MLNGCKTSQTSTHRPDQSRSAATRKRCPFFVKSEPFTSQAQFHGQDVTDVYARMRKLTPRVEWFQLLASTLSRAERQAAVDVGPKALPVTTSTALSHRFEPVLPAVRRQSRRADARAPDRRSLHPALLLRVTPRHASEKINPSIARAAALSARDEDLGHYSDSAYEYATPRTSGLTALTEGG
jgi:hypothetical protein